MIEIISGVTIVIGAAFCLVAALGLLRFPDLYTRMHSASKAGTLGAGVMLLSIAIASGAPDVVTRAVAGFLFLLLTAPIAAHLLARAAYVAGYRPWPGTRIDELDGQYDPTNSHLSSVPDERGK